MKVLLQAMSLSFRAFLADTDRYRLKPRSRIGMILITQGLWACVIYRFFYPLIRAESPFVRHLSHVASLLLQKWIEIVAGISLPVQCEIGPGLHIDHFGGIIINPGISIGTNCNLGHGVTIGSGGRGSLNGVSLEGVPRIGDRVFIGPGAAIFGPISIGNDVAIGANAVVTKSLPDRAVALGVPARSVNFKGSFMYVNYIGMESDPCRLQSLRMMADSESETP